MSIIDHSTTQCTLLQYCTLVLPRDPYCLPRGEIHKADPQPIPGGLSAELLPPAFPPLPLFASHAYDQGAGLHTSLPCPQISRAAVQELKARVLCNNQEAAQRSNLFRNFLSARNGLVCSLNCTILRRVQRMCEISGAQPSAWAHSISTAQQLRAQRWFSLGVNSAMVCRRSHIGPCCPTEIETWSPRVLTNRRSWFLSAQEQLYPDAMVRTSKTPLLTPVAPVPSR